MKYINWLDVKYGKEEKEAIIEVLDSGDISGFSSKVEEFEELARNEIGIKHAIACSNGTVALIAALMALKRNCNRYDFNIAVPTWTYIAPVNAADLVGKVVLVDSNNTNYNIGKFPSPEPISVIIPVDMAGIPADYNLFKKYGVPILADAAESLGAIYKDRKVGNLADITITSFHSSKVITTGEGGMIFTDNDELAKLCRNFVNQGYGPKGYDEHYHVDKGYNFRMPGLQAALGCVQIKKLKELVEERQKRGELYKEILGNEVKYPEVEADVTQSYYSFLILLPSKNIRDNLKLFLLDNGIETKIWKPVHTQPPYSSYHGFPNAEYIYEHHLRLPIHNNLSEFDIEYVAEKVLEGLKYIEKNKSK